MSEFRRRFCLLAAFQLVEESGDEEELLLNSAEFTLESDIRNVLDSRDAVTADLRAAQEKERSGDSV